MIKKKSRLSTSARLVELSAAEQTQVNGGQVFGVTPAPGPSSHPPIFGLWLPGHHPVFGVIINPKHKKHKKPPFFGVPVHP